MDTGRLTDRQVCIMTEVMRGSEDGDFIDLDQLIERVPYDVTKEAIQYSIRFLIRRGLIEKKPRQVRRGRRRAVYALTTHGLSTFDPGTGQFDIVNEGVDLDLDVSESDLQP